MSDASQDLAAGIPPSDPLDISSADEADGDTDGEADGEEPAQENPDAVMLVEFNVTLPLTREQAVKFVTNAIELKEEEMRAIAEPGYPVVTLITDVEEAFEAAMAGLREDYDLPPISVNLEDSIDLTEYEDHDEVEVDEDRVGGEA